MNIAEVTSALARELETSELEPLDENFYKEALNLLKSLRESMETDIFANYEYRVIVSSLRKIFLLRIKKLVNSILEQGTVPDIELPEEERKIAEQLIEVIRFFQGELKKESVEKRVEARGITTQGKEEEDRGHIESLQKEERKQRPIIKQGVLVIFSKPYSKILIEGLPLGPFSSGDLAFIPRRLAEELREKGIVDILEEFSLVENTG